MHSVVSPPPSVSLIAVTYNWPEALVALLESVRRQTVMPLEVIVADDGSRAEMKEVVLRYAATSTVPVIHVWQEDRGFRAAAARNRGLARAKGDRVVFVDGDVILHPAFVASHQAFARPGEYIQGSRAPMTPERSAAQLANPRLAPHWWERGVRRMQNAIHAPWLVALNPGAHDGRDGTRSCNLGVWRADAIRVNGFDEAYEGWGREDTDFCTRLIHAGVRRRDLKFAAVQFHLHHRDLSRDSEPRHEQRLAEVIRTRAVRAEKGVDQYG